MELIVFKRDAIYFYLSIDPNILIFLLSLKPRYIYKTELMIEGA